MSIDLHRLHHTTRLEARERVEAIAADLVEDLSIAYTWEGDRLSFRRTGLSGYIDVDDQALHLYLKRSRFLPLSESWIENQVTAHLNAHFPAPAANESAEPANAKTEDDPDDPPEEPVKAKDPGRNAPDSSLLGKLVDLAGDVTKTTLGVAQSTSSLPLNLARGLLGSLGDSVDADRASPPKGDASDADEHA